MGLGGSQVNYSTVPVASENEHSQEVAYGSDGDLNQVLDLPTASSASGHSEGADNGGEEDSAP